MDSEREMTLDRPEGAVRVLVRRSSRRRRTVSARREQGAIVVMIPAHLSRREEHDWVTRMVDKVEAKKGRSPRSDEALELRAAELALAYLDPGVGHPVRPRSIRWVSNQQQRWGSCSSTGDIRLSDRLSAMPAWVIDYVIVHELAHLVELNHTKRFHALVGNYPLVDKATGFLEGWAQRGQLGSG